VSPRDRDEMFAETGTPWAPWYVVPSDDKRRTRLDGEESAPPAL
jgi:polyphosphate kinase 2 (PPK2 family)